MRQRFLIICLIGAAMFAWYRHNTHPMLAQPATLALVEKVQQNKVLNSKVTAVMPLPRKELAPKAGPPKTIATFEPEPKPVAFGPEIPVDYEALRKEVSRGEQYLTDVLESKFPAGQEASREIAPDGRQTIAFIVDGYEQIKQMLAADGSKLAEQFVTVTGNKINKMYYPNGQVAEVNYLSTDGNGYSIMFDETGKQKERRDRVGKNVFSTKDGSWQKLFEQTP